MGEVKVLEVGTVFGRQAGNVEGSRMERIGFPVGSEGERNSFSARSGVDILKRGRAVGGGFGIGEAQTGKKEEGAGQGMVWMVGSFEFRESWGRVLE